jgi:hypothetical protein
VKARECVTLIINLLSIPGTIKSPIGGAFNSSREFFCVEKGSLLWIASKMATVPLRAGKDSTILPEKF